MSGIELFVQVGAAVVEDGDGGAHFVDAADVDFGSEEHFLFAGFDDGFAPRFDDAGVAEEVGPF